MSWKSVKKVAKRALLGHGLSRKQFKSVRRKLGLTSDSKLVRSVRRSMLGNNGQFALSGAPTSAVSYQPRSISSLMGGV